MISKSPFQPQLFYSFVKLQAITIKSLAHVHDNIISALKKKKKKKEDIV